MPDIWLRSNPRVTLFGLITAVALVCAGGWLLFFTGVWHSLGEAITASALLRLVGGLGLLLAGAMLGLLSAWFWRRPRLACDGEMLIANLGGIAPIRVPVEVVECFFIGQGPAMIVAEEQRDAQAANVIVRLAESADAWRSGPAQTVIAHWCDSYITIRGAWCEPIDGDLVERMNKQLAEVHRQRRQAAKPEVA